MLTLGALLVMAVAALAVVSHLMLTYCAFEHMTEVEDIVRARYSHNAKVLFVRHSARYHGRRDLLIRVVTTLLATAFVLLPIWAFAQEASLGSLKDTCGASCHQDARDIMVQEFRPSQTVGWDEIIVAIAPDGTVLRKGKPLEELDAAELRETILELVDLIQRYPRR